MLIWMVKHIAKILLGIVSVILGIAMLIGLIYGVLFVVDYTLFGTVIAVDEWDNPTVAVSPASAFLCIDRMINGGERAEQVWLAYNGNATFEVGDRVLALASGATRSKAEMGANLVFLIKFPW